MVTERDISKARALILSNERQGNCYYPLIDTFMVARNGVEEKLNVYCVFKDASLVISEFNIKYPGAENILNLVPVEFLSTISIIRHK